MTVDVDFVEPDSVASPVHITDHVARGVARLTSAVRAIPRAVALLTAFLNQVQDLEDALWALYTDRLSTAVGAQLDVLGRLLGEGRGGLSDGVYRWVLLAAAVANRSDGTGDDLLRVARAVLGGPGAAFTLTEVAHATVVVEPAEPWPSGVDVAHRLLRKAKAGGVRLYTVDLPEPNDGGWFEFASAGALLPEADAVRGFGDTANPGTGGRWAGVYVA